MGHPLDARSDIYSLGVLAYRMLSGSLPFNGPNARDYLLQHIGTAPTPLVENTLSMADDPDLSAIVMRCLAKEPRSLFQTAEDLVRALESPPQVAGRILPLLPRAISTVSEVIFARRPQVDARPAPSGPVLELPTGAVTPVPPPRVADTLSSSLGPPRWRRPLVVALGALIAVAGVAWYRARPSRLDEAARQLDAGKPREALATLERFGTVSEAATRLRLTQSAVSHALARLRDLFGDPLFVRRPHGLEPTKRAMALGPRIEALIELADATLKGLEEIARATHLQLQILNASTAGQINEALREPRARTGRGPTSRPRLVLRHSACQTRHSGGALSRPGHNFNA